MRHYYKICILAALALVASACAKVVPDEPGTRSIIGFNTVCTKAVTSKYPTTVPFRSTAFSYSGTWDANKSPVETYINEELVKYNSTYSYWITYDDEDNEKAYPWPGGDTKLTFFSYSPSSLKGRVSVSTDGVGISSWDVTTDNRDILVADIAQDKTKNESLAGYTGVPTLFKHKLSRIVFEFGIADDASDDTKISLTSIVLKDVYSSGSYSRGGYADDKWTPSPSALETSWSLFAGDLELSKSLSTDKEFNMIPQSLLATGTTHPELVIGYKLRTDDSSWESKTATCYFDENLRLESWEKGKKYTYKIYIGVGQYPIKFTGGVTEWSNGDTSTITIG